MTLAVGDIVRESPVLDVSALHNHNHTPISSSSSPSTLRVTFFSAVVWTIIAIVYASMLMLFMRNIQSNTCIEARVWLSMTLFRVCAGALIRIFICVLWVNNRGTYAQRSSIYSAARIEQAFIDPGSFAGAVIGLLLSFPPFSPGSRLECGSLHALSLASIFVLAMHYFTKWASKIFARFLYFIGRRAEAGRWERFIGVRVEGPSVTAARAQSRVFIEEMTLASYSAISIRGDSCIVCTDNYEASSKIRVINCGRAHRAFTEEGAALPTGVLILSSTAVDDTEEQQQQQQQQQQQHVLPKIDSSSSSYTTNTAATSSFLSTLFTHFSRRPTHMASPLILDGHHFHAACLDRWLDTHNSCPICRAPVYRGLAAASAAEQEETNAGEIDRIAFLARIGLARFFNDSNETATTTTTTTATTLHIAAPQTTTISVTNPIININNQSTIHHSELILTNNVTNNNNTTTAGIIRLSPSVRRLFARVAGNHPEAVALATAAAEDGDLSLAIAILASVDAED
jgi:hypothetical protein